MNMALTYLFRKATREVKHFNKEKLIDKIATEQDEILFSRNRLLDTMNFAEMGDLGLRDLPVMGVKANIPVIDRHSPLAYCIAQHIHWNVTQHRGIETCNRTSLQHCMIMQGMSLYKELADDCLWCSRKRKRLLEVAMGPVSNYQLAITPPFWCCQVDLFGPITCYVPGYEKSTRARPASSVKTWILTSVCVVTKLVNCQVIEKSDASAILDAMTRLGCEVGLPSVMLADQDSTLMKAIKEAKVNLVNLKLELHEEKGIQLELCSVGGHNEHGLVERTIRSVQESLEESGLKMKRLSATGLQTLAKLVENSCNNLPIGFKYDKSPDNTEALKILTPNMMRMGRINTRALSGPLTLPSGMSDMVDKVVKTYEAWYKVWSDAYIPKLLSRPKWFRAETDIQVGDIVYFQKSDSELGSSWILGVVSSIERSRDNLIRKVDIRYRNSSESQDRFTNRSVRKICKIWSETDWNLQDDLAELVEKLEQVEGGKAILDNVHLPQLQRPPDHSALLAQHQGHQGGSAPDGCCCVSHCSILHTRGARLRPYKPLARIFYPCELQPNIPSLKKALFTEIEEQITTTEAPIDSLSEFILNFTSN